MVVVSSPVDEGVLMIKFFQVAQFVRTYYLSHNKKHDAAETFPLLICTCAALCAFGLVDFKCVTCTYPFHKQVYSVYTHVFFAFSVVVSDSSFFVVFSSLSWLAAFFVTSLRMSSIFLRFFVFS